MTYSPTITYGSIRAEKKTRGERLYDWACRHRETVACMTASGIVGLMLTAAAIYSLMQHPGIALHY